MAKKSKSEARAERMTWFLLVLMFVSLNLLPENVVLPNATIPFLGGSILFFSGIYQYFRKWRVNFVTWIAATLMIVMGVYNVYTRPDLNFTVLALVLTVIVIVFGIITNET